MLQSRLPGLIMNQMERTFNIVQKALNITDEQSFLSPPRPPLTDLEFRGYLDSVGRIVRPEQLRRVIYIGGIEPSLRRVVWKHILNVYPEGMTGKERMDYMKRKASEYCSLREVWRMAIQGGGGNGGCGHSELAYVTGMVRKDVLRTDRLHPFYAGHDDNQNIASLFNILTTYALNHPAVSYCQGMSDIASPLLVTMNDEAHAYICFCAVMRRLSMNFMIDGLAMTMKFAHLTEALQYYDPEFYGYLRAQQADDLLFCYRWLLLEMKREFAFSDSLRMLEVLWSSLPADPPEKELILVSRPFQAIAESGRGLIGSSSIGAMGGVSHLAVGGVNEQEGVVNKLNSDGTQRETVYTKICALRRQNSALSLCSSSASPSQVKSPSPGGGLNHRFNQSLNESRLSRSQSREMAMMSPGSNVSAEERKFVFPPTNDSEGVVGPGVAKRVTNPFLSPSNLSPGGGHFKDLKHRLAKKSRSKEEPATIEEKEGDAEGTSSSSAGERTPQRVVKSFNEFLNFASAGTKIKWQGRRSQDKEDDKVGGAEGKKGEDQIEQSQENSEDHDQEDEEEESSPDDTQEYFPMTTSITRELRLELENLDRQVFGVEGYKKLSHQSTDTYDEDQVLDTDQLRNKVSAEIDIDPHEISKCPPESEESLSNGLKAQLDLEKRLSTCSITNNDVFVWENPLNQFPSSASIGSLTENVEVETVPPQTDGLPPGLSMFVDPLELSNQMANSSCEEAAEAAALMTSSGHPLNMSIRMPGTLPPPPEFGGGNPFLMFLSLTLLLQHRDFVMKSGLDYNEMAMHFDKMVRKHNVTRTLNQARQMYSDYLASFKGRLGSVSGNSGDREGEGNQRVV